MNWTKELVIDALKKVSERAAFDEQFRALAISDIHAAIQEVSGKEITKNFKINVVDNTGYHISVMLPQVSKNELELSEDELENVSGGIWPGAFDYDFDKVREYDAKHKDC